MKIGFIGCGNMGGALVNAASKSVNVSDIYVYDRSGEKTEALESSLGVIASGEEKIIADAKYIFLGVKPQVLKNAIGEITIIKSACLGLARKTTNKSTIVT
ncbi:MAG: NAD(P)-binding domain-containing protein [Clostridia bacterium]|nr:NAD(P)-binding domain-containing protein [Clostridia bacterium]